MQVTELTNIGLNFSVKIIIPAIDITKEVEQKLLDLAPKVKVDGFRFGKVPLSIVAKKYQTTIKSDVLQERVTSSIQQVIKDHNLNIVTDPVIDDLKAVDGLDLEFVLKFELMPKVSLPDFKKIALEKPVLEILDSDIDRQIEELAILSKQYTKESKSKAAKGDQVTIDAVGYTDHNGSDQAFDGGKLSDHQLVLGSKSFIDTFEDQLIGAKAGDQVSVKVTFPGNYPAKNLAGRPAEFKVVVKAIHKPVVPEINDQFAQKFNCADLEKLRQQVSENITASFAGPIHTLMKINLFDQLETILQFELPESLIAKEYQLLQAQIAENQASTISTDQSGPESSQYCRNLSLRRVRIGLVLAEYIQVKDLKAEQNDFQEAVLAQARTFPGQERSVIEFYQKNPENLASLRGPILEEKAVKHIFDQEITITTKLYAKKALEKFLAQKT